MRGLIILALLFPPSLVRADVVTLLNGDRISGRVLGKTTKRVRLQTPYGLLSVPSEQVAQIERDDGTLEVLNAPPAAPEPPPPPPPPEPARIHLAVSGDTFWHAWDPSAAPADPSLRLELRLDGTPVVSYTDLDLDPGDLPKAVVNSFVFAPDRLVTRAGEGVIAAPPIAAGGEIGLALKLPAEWAGSRILGIAYQVNDGDRGELSWRDVVSARMEVRLEPEGITPVRLEQGRGTMGYARRRMQDVETFVAVLRADPEVAEHRSRPRPPAPEPAGMDSSPF